MYLDQDISGSKEDGKKSPYCIYKLPVSYIIKESEKSIMLKKEETNLVFWISKRLCRLNDYERGYFTILWPNAFRISPYDTKNNKKMGLMPLWNLISKNRITEMWVLDDKGNLKQKDIKNLKKQETKVKKTKIPKKKKAEKVNVDQVFMKNEGAKVSFVTDNKSPF